MQYPHRYYQGYSSTSKTEAKANDLADDANETTDQNLVTETTVTVDLPANEALTNTTSPKDNGTNDFMIKEEPEPRSSGAVRHMPIWTSFFTKILNTMKGNEDLEKRRTRSATWTPGDKVTKVRSPRKQLAPELRSIPNLAKEWKEKGVNLVDMMDRNSKETPKLPDYTEAVEMLNKRMEGQGFFIAFLPLYSAHMQHCPNDKSKEMLKDNNHKSKEMIKKFREETNRADEQVRQLQDLRHFETFGSRHEEIERSIQLVSEWLEANFEDKDVEVEAKGVEAKVNEEE